MNRYRTPFLAAAASAALLLTATPAQADERRPRPFVPSGDVVAPGGDPRSAPLLSPGLHRATLGSGEGTRYYTVRRAPGAGLALALTWADSSADADEVKLTVSTPGGGSQCASETAGRSAGSTPEPMTVAATIKGAEPDATPGAGGECANAPELVVGVERTKGGRVDAEVLVVQQPGLKSATGLPAAASGSTPSDPAEASGQAREVTGGGTFTSAAEVTPGMHLDRLYPGDTAFYRVKVDYGQAATVTMEAPAPGAGYQAVKGEFGSASVKAQLLSPTRERIDDASVSVSLYDDRPSLASLHMLPVRYLNQFGYSGAKAYLGGYYYVKVTVQQSSSAPLNRTAIPVRLRVRLDGQPGGRPEFSGVDAAMTDAPAASSSQLGVRDDSILPWVIAGGAGGALLLGGIGYLLVSRRRSS